MMHHFSFTTGKWSGTLLLKDNIIIATRKNSISEANELNTGNVITGNNLKQCTFLKYVTNIGQKAKNLNLN